MSEFEQKIIEAYRHIGDTVYSTVFGVAGEEPIVYSEKIHYIEVANERIDLMGDYGTLICSFDQVGRLDGDLFSSFSSSEVEEKIEEWKKKNKNF